MTRMKDHDGVMSSPKPSTTTTAATRKDNESGVEAVAAAFGEKPESLATHADDALASSPATRRRWRRSRGSRYGKENHTTFGDQSTAIVRTTPSKSRSSSNWGQRWRSSNDNDDGNGISNIGGTPKSSSRDRDSNSRRRSFGVSPKAFHAAAAAAPTAALAPPIVPIPTKAGQESVVQLHATVQSNLILHGKKQVMERHKWKRRAFKQVTCLQTWPLQERALHHYQQLLSNQNGGCVSHGNPVTANNNINAPTNAAVAYNNPTTIQEDETCQKQQNEANQKTSARPTGLSTPMAVSAATNHTCSGTLSASSMSSSTSSSSSSAFSMDEPKRLLRDLCMSPAKSRLKFQLQQEFLQQQQQKSRTKIIPMPLSSSSNQEPDEVDDYGPALWCMEPRVFSVEKSELGKRKYIVGQAGRFFDYYWRKVNRNHRHYYELILQDTPCRLYLDLEFHRPSNPVITNPVVAEEFLSQLLLSLSQQLKESFPRQFGIDFQLDRTHIVDLDSSTEKKFSRHWIVHLPGGYLFAHTTALGRFMQEWVGNILTASQQAANVSSGSSSSSSSVLFEHLFVNPPPPSSSSKPATAVVSASGCHRNNIKTCLIDLGVYTRNRLFRLMGSTKFGKPPSAALRIAETNEFPFPKGFGNASFYLPAMTEHQQQQQESLLYPESKQSSSNDDTVVEVAVEKFAAAMDWTTHAEALAQTLVIPLNATKIDYPILPFDQDAFNNASGPAKASSHFTKSSSLYKSASSTSSLAFDRSPFPMVDDFVLQTLASRGGSGIQGSIRAWSLECHPETGIPLYLTYQMSRNRYCECVGRAHKSNNIAWRVDLVLLQAVQTCHDPECRALQFRGTPVPLPYSVQQQIKQQLASESTAPNDSNKNKPDCIDDDDYDGFEGVDDDAVLEAMASLNLDELESDHRGGAVPPTYHQQLDGNTTKENAESNATDKDDFDDDFPDDALAEAILANPELFP